MDNNNYLSSGMIKIINRSYIKQPTKLIQKLSSISICTSKLEGSFYNSWKHKFDAHSQNTAYRNYTNTTLILYLVQVVTYSQWSSRPQVFIANLGIYIVSQCFFKHSLQVIGFAICHSCSQTAWWFRIFFFFHQIIHKKCVFIEVFRTIFGISFCLITISPLTLFQ